MKLPFSIKTLNYTLTLILCSGFCWSVYLAIYYVTNSQLVYIDKEEGGKMVVNPISTGGRGGFSLRRITFSQVHDVKNERVLVGEVVCIYDWSPVIGIQRRIFLQKDNLKYANRVYFYLCKSRNMQKDEECFAFTAGKRPSNLFFYTDIFRVSMQYYLLFFGLISVIFDKIAKKYFGQKIIKNRLIDNVIPYLIALFFVL
jgi:hypothetical protein